MGSLFDFNAVAAQYDAYYQTEAGKRIDQEEKAMISSLIQTVKPCEMLEIGSGTGHWSAFFTEKGFRVTGIDISEKMVDQANQKQIPGATFLQADGGDLPFRSKSLKFVAMITAMEFMRNSADVLDEINRVLIPGGYIMIAGLNQYSKLAEQRMNDPVLRHARFITPEQLKEILFGFGSVIEIKGSVFFDDQMLLLDASMLEKMVKSERIFSGAFIGGVARKED